MADPGSPVQDVPRRGAWTPEGVTFRKFCLPNERIWTFRGGVRQASVNVDSPMLREAKLKKKNYVYKRCNLNLKIKSGASSLGVGSLGSWGSPSICHWLDTELLSQPCRPLTPPTLPKTWSRDHPKTFFTVVCESSRIAPKQFQDYINTENC